MRAVRVERLDGPDGLRVTEVEAPLSGDGQVLIDVHTTVAVFPDLLQTRGQYQLKPPVPFVPGSVVAGTVAGDAAGFHDGDRVAAVIGLGGWAASAVAQADFTFALPPGMSFEHAAVLPFNYGTMHFALVHRGGLRPGETVLVQGAAGGIGTAAIQLAKALGARTIAVVSSDRKAEVARRAGADDVVPVDGFKDTVRELTGGRGVDVVVDPVGGDRFTDNLRCLAEDGRLLVLGFTGGEIPTVKVNRLLLNNISVVGVGWGAYWSSRPDFLRAEWEQLLPLAATFTPLVGESFALEAAADALRSIDARQAVGTVVLTVR